MDMDHFTTQVCKRNLKVARSGGRIIQGTLLVQGALDHCIIAPDIGIDERMNSCATRARKTKWDSVLKSLLSGFPWQSGVVYKLITGASDRELNCFEPQTLVGVLTAPFSSQDI